MALIYVGNGKYIGGIPAQDISDTELGEMLKSGMAEAVCGKQVSLAEFEGVLISRGIYKMQTKPSASKEAPKKAED